MGLEVRPSWWGVGLLSASYAAGDARGDSMGRPGDAPGMEGMGAGLAHGSKVTDGEAAGDAVVTSDATGTIDAAGEAPRPADGGPGR